MQEGKYKQLTKLFFTPRDIHEALENVGPFKAPGTKRFHIHFKAPGTKRFHILFFPTFMRIVGDS